MAIVGWAILIFIVGCLIAAVSDQLFVIGLAVMISVVVIGLIIMAIGMIQHGDMVTIWVT